MKIQKYLTQKINLIKKLLTIRNISFIIIAILVNIPVVYTLKTGLSNEISIVSFLGAVLLGSQAVILIVCIIFFLERILDKYGDRQLFK